MVQRIRVAPSRVTTRGARVIMPKVAAAIYQTAEYRDWRWAVIARSGGRCQDPQCADPMRETRLYADHVVELRDGGAPFDISNGMARCGSCHTRKTLEERARRMGRRGRG